MNLQYSPGWISGREKKLGKERGEKARNSRKGRKSKRREGKEQILTTLLQPCRLPYNEQNTSSSHAAC